MRMMNREEQREGETIFYFTHKRNDKILGMSRAARPSSYLDSPFAINNNLGSPMGAKKSSTEVRWRKGGSDWLRFLLGKLSRFMLKFLVISLPPNTVFGENPRLRAVRDSFTKSFSTHSPNAQQIHTRVSRTPEKTPLRKKVRAEDFKRWMRNGSFILRMS